MAGYALGFVMGATAGPRFAFYSKCLRRRRMGPPKGSYGNCVPMPPATAAPGYRRVYLRSLSRIVNCDGPCEAGPEYCNCGLLWHDVPIAPKPQFPSPREIPGDMP